MIQWFEILSWHLFNKQKNLASSCTLSFLVGISSNFSILLCFVSSNIRGCTTFLNQASLGATWSTGNSFSTCRAHGHAVDVSIAFLHFSSETATTKNSDGHISPSHKAALTWKAFDSMEWTWLFIARPIPCSSSSHVSRKDKLYIYTCNYTSHYISM